MEQINSNKKHSDRRKYFALLAVVLFIAFSGAYAYWSMELKDMISTDDALCLYYYREKGDASLQRE